MRSVRIGQRIESSPVGQAVIGAFCVLIVLAVLGWNLPAGRPHDRAVRLFGPTAQALGLEQDWALFAPDPRSFGVGVYATLTYSDGHTQRWAPPHNGLLVSPYRTYRWQKYVERLRGDDYSGIWEPTARWIAREHGSDVTKVVLTRTFQEAKVPGAGGPRPALGRYDFYTLDLP